MNHKFLFQVESVPEIWYNVWYLKPMRMVVLSMFICDRVYTRDELGEIAKDSFGDMVKGVVDVGRSLLALDAELHADLESFLLENGSEQKDLWGINLYPEETDDFIEYDSLINIRPMQGNRSRGVENAELRVRIEEVVRKWTE